MNARRKRSAEFGHGLQDANWRKLGSTGPSCWETSKAHTAGLSGRLTSEDESVAEGGSEDRRDIELADDCIEDVDRTLNPLGRFTLPCTRPRHRWWSTSLAAARAV